MGAEPPGASCNVRDGAGQRRASRRRGSRARIPQPRAGGVRTMDLEHSTFTREARALIARRLTPFAVGWTGAMGLWLVVFTLEGRVGWLAVVLVAAAALTLRTAIRVTA